jgi:hypothetical protein
VDREFGAGPSVTFHKKGSDVRVSDFILADSASSARFEIGELALLGRHYALLVSGKETAMRVITLAGLFDQAHREQIIDRSHEYTLSFSMRF